MRNGEKWILFVHTGQLPPLCSPEGQDKNLCPVEMGWKGPQVLTLTFWNGHTSLQGPPKPCVSLWLFMTCRCLQGPGSHFLLKCKHIPSELGNLSGILPPSYSRIDLIVVLYEVGGRARCLRKQVKKRKHALKVKINESVYLLLLPLASLLFWVPPIICFTSLHVIPRVSTYLI